MIVAGTPLNGTLSFIFDGSPIDPDSLSGLLYRGGVETTVPVNLTQLAPGEFQYAIAIPGNWEAGDRVGLKVSYSIDGRHRTTGVKLLGSISSRDLEFLGYTSGVGAVSTIESDDTITRVTTINTDDGRQVTITDTGSGIGSTRRIERTDP